MTAAGRCAASDWCCARDPVGPWPAGGSSCPNTRTGSGPAWRSSWLPGPAGAGRGACCSRRSSGEPPRTAVGSARSSSTSRWRSPAQCRAGLRPRPGYGAVLVNARRGLVVPARPGPGPGSRGPRPGRFGGYRTGCFVGPWPTRWLGARAALGAEISLDAPLGATGLEGEQWDADRVRRHEALLGRPGLVALGADAVPEPSAEVVAFSELWVPAGAPEVAHQDDTVVARAHRLSLGRKVANLRPAPALRPHPTGHHLQRAGQWGDDRRQRGARSGGGRARGDLAAPPRRLALRPGRGSARFSPPGGGPRGRRPGRRRTATPRRCGSDRPRRR